MIDSVKGNVWHPRDDENVSNIFYEITPNFFRVLYFFYRVERNGVVGGDHGKFGQLDDGSFFPYAVFENQPNVAPFFHAVYNISTVH